MNPGQCAAMYYSEYQRIRRIERLFEMLAYVSIFLDVLVAVGTYLVMQHASASSEYILSVGNYLVFLEVSLAAGTFCLLLVLKNYKKVVRLWGLAAFRIQRAWARRRPAGIAYSVLRAFG